MDMNPDLFIKKPRDNTNRAGQHIYNTVVMVRKSRIVQCLAILFLFGCVYMYLSDSSPATDTLDSNKFPVHISSEADTYATYHVDKTMIPTTPYSDDTENKMDNIIDSSKAESMNEDDVQNEVDIENEVDTHKMIQLPTKLNHQYIHQDDDDPNKTEFDLEYRMKKAEIEEVITKRMERVKDVCQRLNYPNSDQYNTYNFGKFGVTWCPTFKASSSTWRDFFIDEVRGPYANFNGEHYHLGVLGNQVLTRTMISHATSAKGRKRVFRGEPDSNVRFTVVRHPFSRIISHQRKAMNYPFEIRDQRGHWVEDAVLDGRTDPSWRAAVYTKYKTEYETYVREIVAKKYERTDETRHKPFSEDNPYLHPPYPTVSELVNFIMKHRETDDRGLNGHWRPTIEWCDICQNDLDIIIQLEEEPMELLYLLDRMNMWEHRKHFLGKHNSSGNKSAGQEEIANHKAQLTQGQIDYLNQMYAADLEMFGYDPI